MDKFESRKYIIRAIFIVLGLLYCGRLYMLQVQDNSLKTKASDVGVRTVFPPRGLIFDRYGKLITGNKPNYELLLVQAQLSEIDTAKFCKLLGINDSIFNARIDRLKSNRRRYSPYKPAPFLDKIPYEVFTVFEEHLHEFPGFYPQLKMVRTYPFKGAAHVLGDIGEVNAFEREKSRYYYKLGEFLGKSGLEKYYEAELRGSKGVEFYLKDNIGRDLGSFQNGAYDTISQAGNDLITTLDIELQLYGEKLMQNKRGSIVAIEPSTGEVLAFVSSPSYDPNLLVGRDRGKNFFKLTNDTINKPLINRPLTAIYPPGSIFKPFMGLAAVNENVIGKYTGYTCNAGYHIGSLTVGCHHHIQIKNLNMAVEHSCNAYFCNSLKQFLESNEFKDESEALDKWADYMDQFGLGRRTGLDLLGEFGGNIPNASYYDKQYSGWRWGASTVISIAIGQGEITTTPLQMANLYAILANRGKYITPHLAKKFKDDLNIPLEDYEEKSVDISESLFEHITTGLENVVKTGTAKFAYLDSISICGKTGTSENPHGEDHSIFAAFSPRENPNIAIAVVIENSGFGGTWAAPIASLMIEFYNNRRISDGRKWHEERILNADFINEE